MKLYSVACFLKLHPRIKSEQGLEGNRNVEFVEKYGSCELISASTNKISISNTTYMAACLVLAEKAILSPNFSTLVAS